MTPAAFQQWCRTLALAPSTCDYLATIHGGHPVRRVTSRGNSVSRMYPSSKKGVTIQFESHKVELWATLAMDHDPEVLECSALTSSLCVEGEVLWRSPSRHPLFVP